MWLLLKGEVREGESLAGLEDDPMKVETPPPAPPPPPSLKVVDGRAATRPHREPQPGVAAWNPASQAASQGEGVSEGRRAEERRACWWVR